MKFFRREPNGGDQQQQNNTETTKQMGGQFSSSEVQAASAVASKAVLSSTTTIRAENATEVRPTEKQRAHSLAINLRPSQPIDIRGQARPRAAEIVQQRCPIQLPMLQQQPLQHQPRVIQPRRLSGSPSASLGPAKSSVGHGYNGLGNCQERQRCQEAMRRRLVSLNSRPIDPECPSSSGENNKENESKGLDEGTKKLSRSRKRLNSAELEYAGSNDGQETMVPMPTQPDTKEVPITVKEQSVTTTAAMASNPAQMQRHDAQTPAEYVPNARRAGRIAYLYGVYGQERQPLSLFPVPQKQTTTLFPRSQFDSQTKVPTLNSWGQCGWDAQRREYEQQQRQQFSDYEDCLEMDGDLELLDQDEAVERLVRLHTVSDIIGYAKVVRAQRQEALGRLNDVMGQFDALIRSYTMVMKASNPQGQTEAEALTTPTEPPMLNNANAHQAKAVTN